MAVPRRGDVRWDRVQRTEVRDFVLWLRQARGGAGYAPATIDHNLSVLSVFYDFLGARGEGPVLNPVPSWSTSTGSFRTTTRWSPTGRTGGRCIGSGSRDAAESVDRRHGEPAVRRFLSSRDRALVAMYLASGVRASELLGMRGRDVDWGGP